MLLPRLVRALPLLLLPTAAAQEPEATPAVDPTTLAAPADGLDLATWAAAIAPATAELSFETLGWLPTFAEGVLAADAARKPLLLWVMNGHPLGCT